MKSNLLFFLIFIIFESSLFAKNINIESKNILIKKENENTVFEDEVLIKTEDNYTIKSDYANYDKKNEFIILKNNIIAIDDKKNIIKTNYAEYDGKSKIFKSLGPAEIITSENYEINGEDIIIDSNKNLIYSNKKSIITDESQNEIYLDNFKFLKNENIFKSIGRIEVIDQKKNKYEFSQIYIDTKKKEILGTDIKSFINDPSNKYHINNKPRIFANNAKITNEISSFDKSVFTICDYRKDDKCPPWSVQATKMLHDNKKKTIYYDNAVVKVYDIPIFFFPKLSHPDPTVKRRSGFLVPTFVNSKNLGSSLSTPYFWALNDDKNLTLTPRVFIDENSLFLGEFHQAFKNSSLLADFGYTKGYKNQTAKKKKGDKSHFFGEFFTNFRGKNNSENSLKVLVQNVSNDKYLKLYKIDSNLVNYQNEILENSLDFSHENEDLFFGLKASVFESLKEDYNDKYEYIAPEITLDKNLFINKKYGSLDLITNFKTHNYETNKFTNFLVNDFNWNIKEINYNSGLTGKLFSHIKNVNYEARNVELYKTSTTSELYGALGYLSELNLQKNLNNSVHNLTPKFLVRYAPGSMRKETDGSRLSYTDAFKINRSNDLNNFEVGLNSTLGIDYNVKKDVKEFDFSIAQIFNQKENKKMSSESSLDEKNSDLTGVSNFKLNNKVNLNYNFSIDQNYKDFNYNEIGTNFNFDPIEFNFDYLKESKHIGDKEYFKTKISYVKNNGSFTFSNKRNLITNSSEFYDLSYEYLNDCLRAGIVYRREFYNDSELEPENSLMFRITIIPFGDVETPAFTQ